MSKIEWTQETWNPLIGCSKISPGCKNCYAIQTAWIRQHNPKMAERYSGVVEKTPAGALNWTGNVNVVKEVINKPLLKQKPTMYFVNSMSDLFHEAVPFSVIHDIFDTIAACPQHTFQIQWGEYYTKSILTTTGEPTFRMFTSKQHWVDKAQTWVRGGRCISIDGRECKIGKDFNECAYPVVIMDKVGKKKAGRLLDGREWNEFPESGKRTAPAEDPDLFFTGPDY